VLVPIRSSCRFRFGPFELDPETGELRKNGRKIHLQEKPLQILITLLEQRGTMVSRKVLRQRLWPAETFVDFDNGLNTAVSKLREVLGDSAEEHRYVETLARRGYRFVGTVEEPSALSRSVGRELHIAEKRIEPNIVVVEIGGRIIFGPECHQVEWLIAHLLAEDEKKIILDISHVTRVDSTGVGIIVLCFGKVMNAGGELRVAGTQGIVEETLKIAKVDNLMVLYPTVEAATEGLRDRPRTTSPNP
jgi:anti-anti-sigma factor